MHSFAPRLAFAILFLVLPSFLLADTGLHARYLRGEVQITTTDDGEVLVALDEALPEADPDGLADHLFVLFQDEPFERVDLWLPAARVLFTGQRLEVSGGAEEAAWLFIMEEEAARLLPKGGEGYRIADRPTQIVLGSGLSHTYDGFEAPASVVASKAFYGGIGSKQVRELPSDRGNGLCDAGGQGATECSVSMCESAPRSCSVTCTAPKYACCYCKAFGHGSAKCDCTT